METLWDLKDHAVAAVYPHVEPVYAQALDLILWYPWYFVGLLVLLILYGTYISFKKVGTTNETRKSTIPGGVSQSSVLTPSTYSPSQDSIPVDDEPIRSPDAGKRSEIHTALLRSIRIFGDVFEEKDILLMARSMEFISLKSGESLCKIGDPDKFIYVLQEGRLLVSCSDAKTGVLSPVRFVEKGESVCSILSVMEAFAGRVSPIKFSNINAMEDCSVAKFPVSRLTEEIAKDSQHMLRVVQLTMMWVHRVLFVALFNFLGLSQEIFTTPKQRLPSNNLEERKMSSFNGYRDTNRLPDQQDAESVKLEAILPDADFRVALKDLMAQFGLTNVAVLEKKLKYLKVPAATLIVQANEPDTPLLYVAHGCLGAWTKKPDDDADETMIEVFQVHRGEMLGGLAILSGEPMLFQIETKVISKVIAIHRADFHDILPTKPTLVYSIAQSEINRLSPFIRQIDFGLDWMHLNAGCSLYRLGDEPQCLFIVLAGRLRSIIYRDKVPDQNVEDFCRGDLVGLVELSVQCRRQTTVIAVRDSEVAKIPIPLLDLIKSRHSSVVTRLIKFLGTGMVSSIQRASENFVGDGIPRAPARPETMTTIAVVPVDDVAPLAAFCAELEVSFNNICKTLRITSDDVKRQIGHRALDNVGAPRLSAWLSQKEDENRIVLYQGDLTMTEWTERCVRQADCVLLVGMGDRSPSLNEVDQFLSSKAESLRARKDLVLLHKLTNMHLESTSEWIATHSWISLHHHISCPERMFFPSKKRRTLGSDLGYGLPKSADKNSDFSRLARILTGTAVGLVLGGGGARGFCHIGVIESLMEAGIPIDMIGGVSMGAFVSALYAHYRNVKDVRDRAKIWAFSASDNWNLFRELTYPYMAMFRGRLFNNSIKQFFGEIKIEELSIPYFTASTDLTDISLRVHTRGALWRYVRASMTIVGYLPPLCDPEDGHLLVDGGYMNNVPADVMRQRGAGIILAVDVGREAVRQTFNFGDEFNGWHTLLQRFWPWGPPLAVPNITDLQSRLAYVRSAWLLAGLKKARWCNYIRPPITTFQTLEFRNFDEITDVGYYFGQQMLVSESPLRLKLAEIGRQLLTTSFGLYIPTRRPQPVLGQYLTDLASYVRVFGPVATEENLDHYEQSSDMSVSSALEFLIQEKHRSPKKSADPSEMSGNLLFASPSDVSQTHSTLHIATGATASPSFWAITHPSEAPPSSGPPGNALPAVVTTTTSKAARASANASTVPTVKSSATRERTPEKN